MRIDIRITIPERWNDLSEWQVRMIGRIMFNSRNEQVETSLLKRIIVIILLVSKPTFKALLKATILVCFRPLSEVESFADFIFDRKNLLTRFPNYIKVGRWPFRTRLYGPAPRMANATIQELSYADTFFYKWVTEEDGDDLQRLVAILYRPANKNPDPKDMRAEFSPLLLDRNSKLTDKIPVHVKFMIASAYEGSRDTLVNRHPNVFPKKKVDEEESKKPAKKKPYMPFSKIINSMAMDEVQVFGKHQDVEKVLAPKFLEVYEESIKKQNELQRRNDMNNHRNRR